MADDSATPTDEINESPEPTPPAATAADMEDPIWIEAAIIPTTWRVSASRTLDGVAVLFFVQAPTAEAAMALAEGQADVDWESAAIEPYTPTNLQLKDDFDAGGFILLAEV